MVRRYAQGLTFLVAPALDHVSGMFRFDAATYLAFGTCAFVIWTLHSRYLSFAIFTLLSLAFAIHSAAGFRLQHAISVEDAFRYAQYGRIGLIAAFVLVPHFVRVYTATVRGESWLWSAYIAAAVCETLNALDLFRARDLLATPTGGGLTFASVSLSPLGITNYALAALASVWTVAMLTESYIRHRKAMPLLIGSVALLVTTLNDLALAMGALASVPLVEWGFAAFEVGGILTTSVHYARNATQLRQQREELELRTRELRRSYEELRAAQEELVHKEQLAVVGELAAVIAHEVRNPLAIITNAVAGLRKESLSRADHGTLLTILDEETSRLNRLVGDLLRYARPIHVERSPLALTDLLDRALKLAQDKPDLKVEFAVDVPDVRIWGDGNLLRQVFDNLVDNAVQAMINGGTLAVRIRAMTENAVEGLAVDITDTGEGMDTQVRSRARDPFFTTRPSGTGLGLAIVDRIVTAHGGLFTIDSRSGEGATVTVFLPLGNSIDIAPELNPPPGAARTLSDRPPSKSSSIKT